MTNEISEGFKEELMQCKSLSTYERWWRRYTEFKKERSLQTENIATFLEFMRDLNKTMKVSTMWQAASCINKYIKFDFQQDYITNHIFKSYMKKLQSAYCPVKSSILEMSDIEIYLADSDKSNENLVVKVAMICGVYGALRISEITYLNFEDFRKQGPNYVVTIRQSKTDQAGCGHEFYITPSPRADVCPCAHISSYIALFADPTGRFFRKVKKDGKVTAQVLGVNTIGKFPRKIADFCGKQGNYTGHCFRRSSATIVVDNGANALQLKRLGRWKSSTVAEGYVQNSKMAKIEVAGLVSGQSTTTTLNRELSTGLQNCTFTNCSVNITYNK